METAWIVVVVIALVVMGIVCGWIGHYVGYNSGRRDEENEHRKGENP